MSAGSVALVCTYPPPLAGMSHQASILADYLESEGLTVHRIRANNYHGIPPLRDLSAWWQFWKVVREVDVVNVQTCCYTSYFGTSAPIIYWAKKLGKRVVVTYKHGAAREVFDRTGEFGLRWMRMADVVTVQSGFLKDVFNDFNLETCTVNDLFEPDTPELPPKRPNTDAPKIIMTRGFGHYYNPICTVKAFEMVVAKYPRAELAIAGAGSLEAMTRQYVKSNRVPNVTMPGQVSRARIHDLLREADILINSSNIDNCPGSLLEAFVFGVPIASTAAGGIPYMVEHDVSARLVPVKDHEALGRETLYLLENPDIAREHAAAAQKSLDQYRWDHVREGWFEALALRPESAK
jgi:glycosyltransferase involved in cell wall biosynthesis